MYVSGIVWQGSAVSFFLAGIHSSFFHQKTYLSQGVWSYLLKLLPMLEGSFIHKSCTFVIKFGEMALFLDELASKKGPFKMRLVSPKQKSNINLSHIDFSPVLKVLVSLNLVCIDCKTMEKMLNEIDLQYLLSKSRF